MPKKRRKKQVLLKKPMKTKRFIPIAAILLFALGGTYWLVRSNAAVPPPKCESQLQTDERGIPIFTGGRPTVEEKCVSWAPNPSLSRSCGLDLVFLVDTSGSMQGKPLDDASRAVGAFARALQGTQTLFAIANIDSASSITNQGPATFTSDPGVIQSRMFAMQGSQGSSALRGVNAIKRADPRPDRPNLIIVLSDFRIGYNTAEVNETKQAGTRIIGLVYGTYNDQLHDQAKDAVEWITGPNINTGGIINSDAITVRTETIGASFAEFAKDLCFSGNNGIGNGGNGHGSGGTGTGTGGAGTGTGGAGTGTGPGPGASGGGGSIANTQAEQPNPLPSSSAQGDSKENPEVEPSPFFDGKEYKPGSDPIDKALGNLKVGGKGIIHGWLYLIGIFLVIGNLVAGYFLWWRRLSLEEQIRWKTKLHLRN